MNDAKILIDEIPEEMAGLRLDQALAKLFPDYSRSRITQWIKQGKLVVGDGSKQWKPKDAVFGGEKVQLLAELESETEAEPEPIDLEVVYEDDALIVINKPAGLVVHPAAGHWHGTLVNGLMHRFSDLLEMPRAGIVHRLDKDTTGLLLIARNLISHKHLVEELQRRNIHRFYQAVVHGVMTGGGTIDEPIGRHPRDRKKMAISAAGKDAVTHYRVIKRFRTHTLVQVQLETGRTHQIRVHMAHKRYPIVGDQVYGKRFSLPPGASAELIEFLRKFKRQALHAYKLCFIHPTSGEECCVEAEMPSDMQQLTVELAKDLAANA